MNWINEVEFEDLLEKDAQLVYQHCGIETLVSLWQNLPGITIYLSEKNLFEIKKRYVRKHFNKDDAAWNAKSLAVKLKVSERFVYEALESTDEKDDRQGKLI
ncbi:MAG: hypothetical protein KG012_04285 [Deltaproteobacteria bacterium]|nr:hypothetical protein [Deltaproteobacteria bacterium]